MQLIIKRRPIAGISRRKIAVLSDSNIAKLFGKWRDNQPIWIDYETNELCYYGNTYYDNR